jgi:GDP-4-dehydro-6-deoxy-D-mannose reductase
MRVLITGSSGFVGRHLIRELIQHGHEPLALDLVRDRNLPASVPSFDADILDAEKLNQLVAQTNPEAGVHLSGIAFVPAGWQNPERTLTVNIIGTVNLLEAFRRLASRARVLAISSAQIYGRPQQAEPIGEETPLRPDTPYAISKAAADQLTLLYARQHGLHALVARPYNHIGPGQAAQFVVPAFAEQLLAISRRQAPPTLRVGNLDCRRDFTDVRDVVRAYRLLLEQGQAGQAYNIASGREVSIREILDLLCRQLGVTPAVEIDPARFRPEERQARLSIKKISAAVRWQPEITLAATLRDVVAEMNQAP